MSAAGLLSFFPNLSSLEALQSHRSTLESFGKKVDEKSKHIRSAEILFSSKKADWDKTVEIAQEVRANSDRVVVLAEGLTENLFQAVCSSCSSLASVGRPLSVEIISSSLHPEQLGRLADSIVGQKVSLYLAFHNNPSERLFRCFQVLLGALHKGRHPDEVARRVVVTSGEPATEWERWTQRSPYRTLTFPARCANRYLFFSEPTAYLIGLMGLTAWSFVEGGRSFFRQFEKLSETDDPILAYAALREVQLAEHHRETLVIPDDTFGPFGRWWQVVTEDSRKLFAEEVQDSLVWTGHVMREAHSLARLNWVTELCLEGDYGFEFASDFGVENSVPPVGRPDKLTWMELEAYYRQRVDEQRAGPSYAQPSIRLGLRRRDPFCLGGLFCFFEAIVSVSHRLAEASDVFNLYSPHSLATSGAKS